MRTETTATPLGAVTVAVTKPHDLLPLTVTRTHAIDVIHRPHRDRPWIAEQHEGVTDFYVVLGGAGTVTVGGAIENRRPVANRPGEYIGDSITGGRTYQLAAGDIVNIPPNTPHQAEPDEGGLTYMLMKINVGLYPWSLVSGLQ